MTFVSLAVLNVSDNTLWQTKPSNVRFVVNISFPIYFMIREVNCVWAKYDNICSVHKAKQQYSTQTNGHCHLCLTCHVIISKATH